MSDKNVINEIKQLTRQIETLSQQIQTNLDNGKAILAESNELVRNVSTFTFTLGEMYALENNSKKVSGNVVSNPNNTQHEPTRRGNSFHNIRDQRGRFSRHV